MTKPNPVSKLYLHARSFGVPNVLALFVEPYSVGRTSHVLLVKLVFYACKYSFEEKFTDRVTVLPAEAFFSIINSYSHVMSLVTVITDVLRAAACLLNVS